MCKLPFTPLRIESLVGSAWFTHSNPAVVRAGLFLLDSAWRSDPVGELPADMTALALYARLSVQEMQHSYEVLTDGWVLEGQKLVNAEMRRLGQSVADRFGDELDVMAESSIAAMQGGSETFELFSASAIKTRKGGKVAIKDFAPDAESLASLKLHGYNTEEQVAWAVARFVDYAKTKDFRKTPSQWQAAFRTHVGSSYTLRDFRASGLAQPAVTSLVSKVAYVDHVGQNALRSGREALRNAIGGARTFAQQTSDHNAAAVLAALGAAHGVESESPRM